MTSRTARVSSLRTVVLDESAGVGGIADPGSEAIARAAADLIQPRTAIGISAGPASCAFARQVAGISDLTIVTNSPLVADILHVAAGPRRTVILTGGVRTASNALAGPVATRAIRDLHMDCAFIGAHGVDATAGFTSADLLEAETNRALLANARRLVVLAGHTAWGVVGRAEFGRLSDAAVLVSDEGLGAEAREVLQGSVGALILATSA